MMDIQKLLDTTSAGNIARALDMKDGKADGKISASVWNDFVKDKGGKEIKSSISIENAMKSITTYTIRNAAKQDGVSANDLGNKWLNSMMSDPAQTAATSQSQGAAQQQTPTPAPAGSQSQVSVQQQTPTPAPAGSQSQVSVQQQTPTPAPAGSQSQTPVQQQTPNPAPAGSTATTETQSQTPASQTQSGVPVRTETTLDEFGKRVKDYYADGSYTVSCELYSPETDKPDGRFDNVTKFDKNGNRTEYIQYSYGVNDKSRVTSEHNYYENDVITAKKRVVNIAGKEFKREERTLDKYENVMSYAEYEDGKLVSKRECSDTYKVNELPSSFCQGYTADEINGIGFPKEIKIYGKDNRLEKIVKFNNPHVNDGLFFDLSVTDVKTGRIKFIKDYTPTSNDFGGVETDSWERIT